MPYAVTAMGVRQVIIRKIDGEEILRRVESEGVTLFNGAPAVIAAVLDAAAARRAQGRGGAGRGARAHGRRRGAAAVEDHRARRDRARLGVHPDLRPHRDLAAAHHQPRARGVGRARPGRARAAARRARACPRSACAWRVDAEGEVLARSNHVFDGYWNQPEETAKAIVDGWFHTGDGGYIDGAFIVITRPQEGRDHHRRRERLVDRGGGLPLPAPGGGRGRGDRRARREVGRDDQGARGAAPGRAGDRAGPDRALPEPHGPLQVPDLGRVPRRARPHRHRQAPEVQAPRALLGRPHAAG